MFILLLFVLLLHCTVKYPCFFLTILAGNQIWLKAVGLLITLSCLVYKKARLRAWIQREEQKGSERRDRYWVWKEEKNVWSERGKEGVVRRSDMTENHHVVYSILYDRNLVRFPLWQKTIILNSTCLERKSLICIGIPCHVMSCHVMSWQKPICSSCLNKKPIYLSCLDKKTIFYSCLDKKHLFS